MTEAYRTDNTFINMGIDRPFDEIVFLLDRW